MRVGLGGDLLLTLLELNEEQRVLTRWAICVDEIAMGQHWAVQCHSAEVSVSDWVLAID